MTLWESLGAVGPIGPDYVTKWKTESGSMILYHVLFPLFMPMFLLWGFLNWLSYKTAFDVQWPSAVVNEVESSTPNLKRV